MNKNNKNSKKNFKLLNKHVQEYLDERVYLKISSVLGDLKDNNLIIKLLERKEDIESHMDGITYKAAFNEVVKYLLDGMDFPFIDDDLSSEEVNSILLDKILNKYSKRYRDEMNLYKEIKSEE